MVRNQNKTGHGMGHKYTTSVLWSLATNIHKQYGLYIIFHPSPHWIRSRDPDHDQSITNDALDHSAMVPRK